jgi:cysteinyl-tRNA synthetase
MHGRFLRWNEDDRRMSKSSGEFLVVDDLTAQGFDPLAFRYSCLTASYRVPLTFSWDSMASAADSLRPLREHVRRLSGEIHHAPAIELPSTLADRFRSAIADDLDIPGALAVAWEAVRQANRAANPVEKRGFLKHILDFDRVLGLGLTKAVAAEDEAPPAEIAALIRQREAARAACDWATADTLRNAIRGQGYEVEDTASGTRWRKIA